ncbi:phage tail protein [Alkalilimnicola ehrlichii]|uniref:Phage tail protein n=1 Tax=Alkalilimnicola ehrlichii TaxID=351052 RepID=A0A3E0X3Y5_9GAMM|nr:tail protein X [Alkalilimnicola ehrlichii]RFA31341.1 phage tail protein [Alkalilimnicola ehrlichii]RFA39385.1 phage tail protein [Alkalilimnicola ehrlichii]
MDIAIAKQGDTVDLICQRHYGYTAGVTEAVLEANSGLAQLGPVLPIGTRVRLPIQRPRTTRSTVALWN